jgi:hypothetical protein
VQVVSRQMENEETMIEEILDEIFDYESMLSKDDFSTELMKKCSWVFNS